ncbi:SART-1 family-domain-containing protein [Pavlovales sp. CCMP2436]|nr:SART-1 family-domain-containing protein [Pavlovales sp. CCMP2436]
MKEEELLPSQRLKAQAAQRLQAQAAKEAAGVKSGKGGKAEKGEKVEVDVGGEGAEGKRPARAEGEEGQGGERMEMEGEGEEEDGEEEEEEERDTSFLVERHLASGGIAAALELARSRGLIGAATGGVEAVGRANDLKGSGMHLREGDEGDERVSLKYLDEYGRPMTAKEAFRRQCYNFHGKGPGKRKLEKRMKKYEEEKRMLKAANTDTPLAMMTTLGRVQQLTNEPYLRLTGNHTLNVETIAKAGVMAAAAAGGQDGGAGPSGAKKPKR